MNILYAASELSPYAKTGGLGDVLAALPAVLRKRGHSIACVLPLYRGLLEKLPKAEPVDLILKIELGSALIEAKVWRATTDAGVTLFLIEHDEYFDRTQLYGTAGGDYADNASRFIFFSKAVVELARHLDPAPQIIHVHDWQTGLVPAIVRARGLPFKTVYTIHNLAYQGNFWGIDFGLTNLPGEYFTGPGVEFYGHLNCMKGAITLAHQITTVSPRYAEEIQTEAYGCGLNRVLGEHRHKVSGILNGVDYTLWNPKTDKLTAAPFHAGNFEGKAICKAALLKKLKLPAGDVPVFGFITRLAWQKGVDLLRAIADNLLKEEIRLVILGSGEPQYEEYFRHLAEQYPDKVSVNIGFDEKFAHQIISGSDFFLMPSLYEPCGLTQMYSLHYGTVPIVHETGGLADSVEDYQPDPTIDRGTGFLFRPYAPAPFLEACHRALRLFSEKADLQRIRRQAMSREFSWDRSAEAYEEIYTKALKS